MILELPQVIRVGREMRYPKLKKVTEFLMFPYIIQDNIHLDYSTFLKNKRIIYNIYYIII